MEFLPFVEIFYHLCRTFLFTTKSSWRPNPVIHHLSKILEIFKQYVMCIWIKPSDLKVHHHQYLPPCSEATEERSSTRIKWSPGTITRPTTEIYYEIYQSINISTNFIPLSVYCKQIMKELNSKIKLKHLQQTSSPLCMHGICPLSRLRWSLQSISQLFWH